jgi:hypothetical protein
MRRRYGRTQKPTPLTPTLSLKGEREDFDGCARTDIGSTGQPWIKSGHDDIKNA